MKNHLLAAMLIFHLAGAAQASPTPHTFDAPAPAGVHEVATPSTDGVRPMGLVEAAAPRARRNDRGTLFNSGGMPASLGRVRRAEQRVQETQEELEAASQQPGSGSDFVASGERRVDSHDLELQEDAFEAARDAYRRGDLTALELEERLRFLDSYEGIESLRRQEAEQREERLAQARQEAEQAQADLESARAEQAAEDVIEAAEGTASEVERAAQEAVEEVETPTEPKEPMEPEPPEEQQVASHPAPPPSTVVSDHHQDGLWTPFTEFELSDPGTLPGRSSDWSSNGLDILIHLHDRGIGWTMINRFVEAGGILDLVLVEISDLGRYNSDLKAIKVPPNKYSNGTFSNGRTFTTTLAHEFWHAYYHQVVLAGHDPDTQEVFDEAVEWLLTQDLQKKDGNERLPAVKADDITSWGFDDFEETDFMDEYIGALLNDLVLNHLSIQNRIGMWIEEGMTEDQALERAKGAWSKALESIKNSKYEAYEDADSGDYFVDANPPAELVDHMANLFNLGF